MHQAVCGGWIAGERQIVVHGKPCQRFDIYVVWKRRLGIDEKYQSAQPLVCDERSNLLVPAKRAAFDPLKRECWVGCVDECAGRCGGDETQRSQSIKMAPDPANHVGLFCIVSDQTKIEMFHGPPLPINVGIAVGDGAA